MKMAAFMDKVQFLMGLSMEMACFMDERGGQVALSMKSYCFMDGWGIEEGVVHENGLFHGQQTSVVDEGFGKVQVVEEKWRW
jgi:hypothetical protein